MRRFQPLLSLFIITELFNGMYIGGIFASEPAIYDSKGVKIFYKGNDDEKKALRIWRRKNNDFLKFYQEDVVGRYKCNADKWVLEISSNKKINGVIKVEIALDKLGFRYLRQEKGGNKLKPYYRSVSISDVDSNYKIGNIPFEHMESGRRMQLTINPKENFRYFFYDDKTHKYGMNIIMGCEKKSD